MSTGRVWWVGCTVLVVEGRGPAHWRVWHGWVQKARERLGGVGADLGRGLTGRSGAERRCVAICERMEAMRALARKDLSVFGAERWGVKIEVWAVMSAGGGRPTDWPSASLYQSCRPWLSPWSIAPCTWTRVTLAIAW
jgi:hypothetical protein